MIICLFTAAFEVCHEEFDHLIFASVGVYKTAELWQVKEPLPLPAPKKRNCSMVFTLKEMEEATGMFSDKNLIGKGGFGRVYRGVLKDGQVSSVSTRNTYVS